LAEDSLPTLLGAAAHLSILGQSADGGEVDVVHDLLLDADNLVVVACSSFDISEIGNQLSVLVLFLGLTCNFARENRGRICARCHLEPTTFLLSVVEFATKSTCDGFFCKATSCLCVLLGWETCGDEVRLGCYREALLSTQLVAC